MFHNIFYFYDQIYFKSFIPVQRIFDNENELFIFSRNVRKSSASEIVIKKQNRKYYEILTRYEYVEK